MTVFTDYSFNDQHFNDPSHEFIVAGWVVDIATTFRVYRSSAAFCRVGLKAVQAFASSNEAAISRLGEAGCCEGFVFVGWAGWVVIWF